MAKSAVNRFMATLKAVLNSCVPTHIPALPRIQMFKLPSKEPRWLTPEQFRALRMHLPKHLQLAADLAVLTGLGMRSMSQLTWDRVDLEKGTAWIPGAMMKDGNPICLPLSPEAVATLKALRELSPKGNAVFQWHGK